MIGARGLVRCYPRPMRDRWGSGLEDEVRAGGWRTVPNLLAGAAAMWLHPVLWPAGSPLQRRSRATVTVFLLAGVAWLLGHLLAEEDSLLPRSLAHARPLLLSDLLISAALLLAAPFPRRTAAALRQLLAYVVRRLAVPTLAGLAIVCVANTAGLAVPPAVRHLALGVWWATLLAGVVQTCRLIADLGEATTTAPRLSYGLWTLTAALAAGSATVLAAAPHSARPLTTAVLGVTMLLLTVPALLTLRDLCDVA
ncbi:hypothetical protein ACWT_3156 [Actinoplanes sp. SE50]|uniref:hypothetical protein n=1 Tax=unclassified Actinoplanes TaxID=2626549 RepID=UPI00023EC602|nr:MULTISPECIES: hypothetical protein [unclassified Actinoplanes]AEV84179.1 hypothetical protein ACPL_3284 [Actinoplanes sp. SE50/110]ATO82571.1 hypothetical protein ACWT_3156 [Actinoplanes sp. SE50]SLL99978.1 hypothetical protein ACSP50_3210 [Actinoplanes sp. SE50/110]